VRSAGARVRGDPRVRPRREPRPRGSRRRDWFEVSFEPVDELRSWIARWSWPGGSRRPRRQHRLGVRSCGASK
jgi:hypothetical protein